MRRATLARRAATCCATAPARSRPSGRRRTAASGSPRIYGRTPRWQVVLRSIPVRRSQGASGSSRMALRYPHWSAGYTSGSPVPSTRGADRVGQDLDDLLTRAGCTAALHVRRLSDDAEVALRADEAWLAASVIKVAIAL